MNTVAIEKRLSVRAQVLATLAALASCVLLPQVFHVAGAAFGVGSALGEIFLPMHLPILLVGLLAGRYAGAAAGFLAPLVSFALSGMPGAVMLPFITVELAVYGLVTGLLADRKMPLFVKLLVAQIAGRAVRAVALLISVFALGNTAPALSVIWESIAVGLPGLVLQWALLPLIVTLVHRAENR